MKPAITILLALLAGAAGGVGANWIAGQTRTETTIAEDNTAVLESLQRIEDKLTHGSKTGLTGRASAAGNGTGSVLGDLSDESENSPLAKLLAKIDETVGKSVEAKLGEMSASDEGLKVSIGSDGKVKKKKVSFNEMSRELELSAEEEQKLREIMKNSETEALRLLADEGQDIEDLRRELKEKALTPEGRAEVSGKLATKFMTNLGGFVGLMVKHQASVAGAIGAEKANKIENGYRLVDPDFIDFDAFDFD